MDTSTANHTKKRWRSQDDDLPVRTMKSDNLRRRVSPPPLRRGREQGSKEQVFLSSPFQLTRIEDLPPSKNVNTVSLKDILGNPLISECWEFNYLHDVDFLMSCFDDAVRDTVKVHVVHGFWKNEDPRGLTLKEQCQKHKNVTLHAAYMPEMFGTHHSKMLIIIRHDRKAQIVIHTANMIAFDWSNMTQALWRSPLLSVLFQTPPLETVGAVGSGSRFKLDLLNYLKAYDTKRIICKPLVEKLLKYDFSGIKAALIASIPGRQHSANEGETSWGCLGLEKVLRAVPGQSSTPNIVIQISSIATLGATDKWLKLTLFEALKTSHNTFQSNPQYHVIFPTADEVRRSLNGYQSGSAIHTKIHSPAQAKQLQYMRPFLSHWAGDGDHLPSPLSSRVAMDAGRKRAAPHIKTFIRFSDGEMKTIDWMLVTSANLSKQAWGERNISGDYRICSYEIGVMVWPDLFGNDAVIVPTFQSDMPSEECINSEVVVAARMAYDLPLTPYSIEQLPWCATDSYAEVDWKGCTWNM